MTEISTVLWTLGATVSGMLGLTHALLYLHDRSRDYLLPSAIAALSAGVVFAGELGLMRVSSLEAAQVLLVWGNALIAVLVVSLTWFVFRWSGTGRKSLAIAVTVLWGAGLVVNFVLPGNLTFSEVTEVTSHEFPWGESYQVVAGTINPYKWMPDLASLLFLVFVLEASIKRYRAGGRRGAVVIGGSIVFFILFAGAYAMLADAGMVQSPPLIGFFFLAIVISLSSDLFRELSQASRMAEDLRRMRLEVEHLGRVNLMGELSAAIAHEMGQPLTAIMANAQAGSRFLKSADPDLEEVAEILDDIAGEGKRAREVIQRLRSLLERGESVREQTNLNQIVEESVSLIERELRQNGVSVERSLANDLPDIEADGLGLQQVVINLLLNAERAALKGGAKEPCIGIKTRVEGDQVCLVVTDNGAGIQKENLARLFQPFFTTETNGLGMGLSICLKIAEHHGGKIEAVNRAEGGAAFLVSLPRELSA